MRVLIAGYSYEDSFADNVRCALEEMGHRVRTMGDVQHDRYYAPWRHYLRAIQERIARKAVDQDGRKLLRMAEEFRPDIVLTLTREYAAEVLSTLKKKYGAVLICWWGDPPANVKRFGFADPHYDLVFLKDAAAVQKTRLVRSDVYLLHEAMNPKWHRPLASQKNNAVVIAGNYYAFRQLLVEHLAKQGVELSLFGSNPPAWSLTAIKKLHSGRYIVREEKSRIFGEGLACLNSFNFSEGDSLNCRAFEIAGAGGLQIIEHRPPIPECFEPGKELLVFSTADELYGHIEMARNDTKRAKKVREAGARRAVDQHTYRHRLEVMLGHLK